MRKLENTKKIRVLSFGYVINHFWGISVIKPIMNAGLAELVLDWLHDQLHAGMQRFPDAISL